MTRALKFLAEFLTYTAAMALGVALLIFGG